MNWKDISKQFDEKFHKRMWSIVKQVSPSSYALAEAYGALEGEGPQIYGEMKDYFHSTLDEYVRELIPSDIEVDMVGGTEHNDYDEGYEDGYNALRQELLKQHAENMKDKE